LAGLSISGKNLLVINKNWCTR